MTFYGNKRRRHHQQRPTQDSRPNAEFTFDDELYQLNYSASEKLRTKILSEFSLESHDLPHCSYKRIAKLEVARKTWKPKAPATPRCFYCSFKYNFAGNIISKSNSATLILDRLKNCIVEHQLLLVSNSHLQNTLYLDDNAYTEIRNYQKTLVHMFQQMNRCVIFVEMSMNDKCLKDSDSNELTYNPRGSHRDGDHFPRADGDANYHSGSNTRDANHCKIECYPIPLDYFDEAKCYFTKALDEMGPSWSQNKKMAITGRTGVRGVIPQGFDYIHVDFSLSGEAMAYVIDDPSKLRYTFARNIVAGILNMDQLERAFRDNDQYNKAINNIRKIYKDFDWTNPN